MENLVQGRVLLGRLVAGALALCALCLWSAPAHAQDHQARVTVLELDAASAADQGRAAALYGTLRTQVAYHPHLTLNDVPPQRLEVLLLAVGCFELDPACAELIAEIVGGDLLVFGSIDVENGSVIELFDLRTAATEHRVELGPDAWPESPADESLLARGVLWGPVGNLQVTSDPPGAEVHFGDLYLGTTPVEVRVLPLSRAELRVELRGFARVRRDVAVDIEPVVEHVTLSQAVEIDAAVQRRRRDRSDADASRVMPVVVAASGGVLTAAGIGTAVVFSRAQSDFDDETRSVDFDRERAIDLRDQGERYGRMTNILVPVGLAAVVGGTTWALLNRRSARADTAHLSWRGDGLHVRW